MCMQQLQDLIILSMHSTWLFPNLLVSFDRKSKKIHPLGSPSNQELHQTIQCTSPQPPPPPPLPKASIKRMQVHVEIESPNKSKQGRNDITNTFVPSLHFVPFFQPLYYSLHSLPHTYVQDLATMLSSIKQNSSTTFVRLVIAENYSLHTKHSDH